MAGEDSTVQLASPLQSERRFIAAQAATVNATDAKFESLEAQELVRQYAPSHAALCISNCPPVYTPTFTIRTRIVSSLATQVMLKVIYACICVHERVSLCFQRFREAAGHVLNLGLVW
jgi:hypothetical protein